MVSVRVHLQQDPYQCPRCHCYAVEDPKDTQEMGLPAATLSIIAPAT